MAKIVQPGSPEHNAIVEQERRQGGPAFPSPDVFNHANGQILEGDLGMSLRDYFAAAALTGLVATPEAMMGMREVGKDFGMQTHEFAARTAYQMADAMLVERERFRS